VDLGTAPRPIGAVGRELGLTADVRARPRSHRQGTADAAEPAPMLHQASFLAERRPRIVGQTLARAPSVRGEQQEPRSLRRSAGPA
jgi:hypothetical protein